jgi:hypothetical protein
MDEATANPVFVALLCVARCLIPLIVVLGISYLLRRLGLVAPPTPPPGDYADHNDG